MIRQMEFSLVAAYRFASISTRDKVSVFSRKIRSLSQDLEHLFCSVRYSAITVDPTLSTKSKCGRADLTVAFEITGPQTLLLSFL
jgi:hypothetical protein